MKVRIPTMVKGKAYILNIIILVITLFMAACGKTNQTSVLPKGTELLKDSYSEANQASVLPKSTELLEDSDTNYDIIYKAYINCKDYEWLNQMNFSPCKEISTKYTDVRKLWDFKFERCNIYGNGNADIIMQVNIEDIWKQQFVLLMVFIKADNKYYTVNSLSTSSGSISYKLIDIDGDNKFEILFDYLLLANGTYRYLEIYQCHEKTSMDCIFEKYIDTSSYSMSYSFTEESPKKLLVKENKTYFNTKDKRKIAEKKHFLYQYRDDGYRLKEEKTVWKSNMKDFKSYTL